jgi:hypothetical protein
MGFFTLRGFVFVFTQISFGTLTQLGCGTSLGANVIILEIVSPEKMGDSGQMKARGRFYKICISDGNFSDEF